MKRIIKELIQWISTILYNNMGSKIIYYHDVYADKQYTDMGTPCSLFKEHVEIIRRKGFKITDKITEQDREVMICFDDGFKGIYDTKDFFVKEGLRPTVFLAVSLIGQPGYLNQEEIHELQNLGFIFQSHAWSHSDLTEFSKEELKHELLDSKNRLEEILGKTVDEICFPIGYFSQLVLDECKKYGYKKMYSSIPGNYFDHIYVKDLKTRNLLQYANKREAKLILCGGNEMIRKRYVKMHWKG